MSKSKAREERTYAIIDQCVPKGTTVKLARQLGRSAELVNRWRRPPVDDDDPYGTGLNNPLDTVEAIQDHAFAHAPLEAHLIHLYFARRFSSHFNLSGQRDPLTPDERDREVAEFSKEASDVIEAVLLKASPETVRREGEELKRKIEELVCRVELGIPTLQPEKKIDLPRLATGGTNK